MENQVELSHGVGVVQKTPDKAIEIFAGVAFLLL